MQSMRPARVDDGRVHLLRLYTFQYSDPGHNRRDGSIPLLGDVVTSLVLVEHPA
jgi:hypothetical protein